MPKKALLKIRDKIILDIFFNHLFNVWKNRKVIPKTLAIIRLDAIGDYILFRNYIEILRKSKKFKNYKITLCGNKNWKNLAIHFEKDLVDEFIWIDKLRLQHNSFYLFRVLKTMYKKRFEIVLYPNYSRDAVTDLVARATNAPVRIANAGDQMNIKPHQKEITDTYYTKLIIPSPEVIHEFYRNKEFIKQLLGERVAIKKPHLDTGSVRFDFNPNYKFAVLFPGAGTKKRMWDAKNFAVVADYLFEKYGLKILISGSKQDKYLSDEISQLTKKAKVIDKTGHTLCELSVILSKAEIIMTNDTSAAHIGLAVGTKTLVVLYGRHFGRFFPYPSKISPYATAIYPDTIMQHIDNFQYLSEKYRYTTDLNINEIKPEIVMSEIEQLLT